MNDDRSIFKVSKCQFHRYMKLIDDSNSSDNFVQRDVAAGRAVNKRSFYLYNDLTDEIAFLLHCTTFRLLCMLCRLPADNGIENCWILASSH